MNVIVDTNEKTKQRKIIEMLQKLDVEVTYEHLLAGDYAIPGSTMTILVERKSIFNLLSSVRKGQLWKQLKAMKNTPDVIPLLLIETSPSAALRKPRGWTELSIAGVLNSVLLDWEIRYVFSPNWRWTGYNLLSLCKSVDQSKELHKINFRKKPEDLNEAVQYLVEGIPYCGPVYAKKLLDKFETVQSLANATVEDLMTIPKFGEVKSNFIFKLMRHKYGERVEE